MTLQLISELCLRVSDCCRRCRYADRLHGNAQVGYWLSGATYLRHHPRRLSFSELNGWRTDGQTDVTRRLLKQTESTPVKWRKQVGASRMRVKVATARCNKQVRVSMVHRPHPEYCCTVYVLCLAGFFIAVQSVCLSDVINHICTCL